MVSVSAGVFKYGPAKDTQSAGKFFIDIHEVTAGEYKACVDDEEAEEACDYSGTDLVSDRTYDNSKDDHPVNYVNWFEAVVYCTWKGRRLPTEFEWEKAARGTDGLIYPWGDTPVPDCTRAVMFGCDEDTQSAGRLEQGKSPYGAYDMIGNVYEWTNSWWDGDNNTRVLRGGWFNSSAGDLLSSGRIEKTPFGRYNLGGFRCALSF
jgi:formylglycine-generating enzyme required for sulfatase activity